SAKNVLAVVVAVIVLLIAIYIWQELIGGETAAVDDAAQTNPVAVQTFAPATETGGASVEPAVSEPAQVEPQRAGPARPQSQIMSPVHQSIAEMESLLKGGPTARRTHEAMNQLREQLLAEDPELVSGAIQDFLASGRDAETGLP